MAAGGSAAAAKENAAPSASSSDATTSAAAVSRRCGVGYAVKSCGVKKKRASRPRLLGRVPLRDITNLIQAIEASSPVAGPEASLGQEALPAAATELAKPDAVLPAVVRVAVLKDGDAAGSVAKVARYSLRKGFR